MLGVLSLAVLTGCSTQPLVQAETGCQLVRIAEIPIEAKGHLLFVHGSIDEAPVTLLVDTGADRTLLTVTAVARLNLPRSLQITTTTGLGAPTPARDAELPSGLVLGETRFPISAVSVGHFEVPQADGLLGADVLLAFDLDLDIASQRMTLYRPRPSCREALPPWREPYVAIEGIQARPDRVMMPIELDGVDAMAVLDTGSELSAISHHLADKVAPIDPGVPLDRLAMAGAGPGRIEAYYRHFRELRVGSAVLRSPVLPVVAMSPTLGDALVGEDFLRTRRVWISTATQRIFVTGG